MIKIEISPYDQKDLLELLDFALEMKKITRPKNKTKGNFNDYGFWEIRIPQLKYIISGKDVSPAIYKSALGGYRGNNCKKTTLEESYKFNEDSKI